jgi:hypothetical protein
VTRIHNRASEARKNRTIPIVLPSGGFGGPSGEDRTCLNFEYEMSVVLDSRTDIM